MGQVYDALEAHEAMDQPLAALVEDELSRPAPAEALALSAEMRRRHGDAVDAILFYGSCLRKKRPGEGVLDFYVLVDSYEAAYGSRALAWSNALLPPNVFLLEIDGPGGEKLRAKYAVISSADFDKAAQPSSVHSIVWARFSQPSLLIYARDDRARRRVVDSIVEASVTLVGRMLALVEPGEAATRVESQDLWQLAYSETYKSEFRTESPQTVRSIYDAAPRRFDEVASFALRELERRGVLRAASNGAALQFDFADGQRNRIRFSWHARRRLAKGLYALRLVKSALTIGDWVPYALWKLERQTGVSIELSERQRRHPMLWGWPVLAKLLLRGSLR